MQCPEIVCGAREFWDLLELVDSTMQGFERRKAGVRNCRVMGVWWDGCF